jgi:hypothetical protein
MDIEKAEEKVEKASSFFDTLNSFIKKHPVWSIIIAIVALSELGYLGWDATHEDDYYGDDYYEDDYYYEGEGDLTEDSTYYHEDYQEQQVY